MRRRRPERLLRDLDLAVAPARRANPVLALWRWRYEIGSVLGVGLGVWTVAHLGTVGVVVLAAVVLSLASTRLRQLLVMRLRGVAVQHRVRAACRAARLHTRDGRLPAILWTSPRPRGERILLWLPAGLTVEALDREAETFAVACYAQRAEVIGHARWRHLARLVVVR